MTQEPIRVLHVIGTMDRAGAETLIMELYRHIDRSHVQFDFLIHGAAPCDYEPEIQKLGGRVYRLPFRFNGINAGAYSTCCRAFYDDHPEHPIVHGHILSSAAIYLREARAHDKVTIAHAHSQNYPFSVGQVASFVLARSVVPQAQWFLACSPAAGKDRFGARVVASDRFHVLNNSIDTELFHCTSHQHQAEKAAFLEVGGYDSSGNHALLTDEFVAAHPFILGTVGRLTEVKNQQFLFDVVKLLNDEGLPTLLVIVGKGELQAALQLQAQQRGIADRCLFFGSTSDVASALRIFDGFAFPSLKEGFGIAALEAQASGLPTVLSTGVPEALSLLKTTRRLPLKAGARAWAQAVLDGFCSEQERSGASAEVRLRGYDIHETAAWLERFYDTILLDSPR